MFGEGRRRRIGVERQGTALGWWIAGWCLRRRGRCCSSSILAEREEGGGRGQSPRQRKEKQKEKDSSQS